MADELPGTITKVQGTGLLLSAELDPERFPVVGFDAVEPWCRRRGLGVIHGGINALRFTPHFMITSKEIEYLCRDLDNDTGGWYHKRDFSREAERAIEFVFRNNI